MQVTVSDYGKLAVAMYDGTWWVFNVFTGDLLFKTERMDYPWDANSFGAYQTCSAYGMFFRFGYSGIYAFNWTDGKIVWKYEAPALSPFESPYTGVNGTGVYSFNSVGTILDGKMYAYNTEHSATQPYTRGWSLHCINITTGEGIWRLTGQGLPSCFADGYATWGNSYMGTMFVIGKGKSATTVTAPDTAVPLGGEVVIRGTVLDLSPAQSGTPCVAKESMTTQMEYLHYNGPIGGLWGNETILGVPVQLTAIDSDGTVIDIGTVTTNGYYGTFSKSWSPPAEGEYTILANFAGDESYGSSGASTAIKVGPATEPYPEPIEPEAQVDNTPMLYGILSGVIVAIIIGIVAVLLALRKRP